MRVGGGGARGWGREEAQHAPGPSPHRPSPSVARTAGCPRGAAQTTTAPVRDRRSAVRTHDAHAHPHVPPTTVSLRGPDRRGWGPYAAQSVACVRSPARRGSHRGPHDVPRRRRHTGSGARGNWKDDQKGDEARFGDVGVGAEALGRNRFAFVWGRLLEKGGREGGEGVPMRSLRRAGCTGKSHRALGSCSAFPRRYYGRPGRSAPPRLDSGPQGHRRP